MECIISIVMSNLSVICSVSGVLLLLKWFYQNKKRTQVKDKVALITGANSGLGKACAFAFYKAGCNVILAGRNVQQLQLVQNELHEQFPKASSKAEVLSLDLSLLHTIDRKVAEAVGMFGHVDILINNAGISYRGWIESTDLDVHMKVMTVNYFGQIALTKGILPFMLEAGGGHIVAVSSVQGRISIPNRSAYAASKHACQAYFEGLHAELSDRNIRVCIVSPGYIKTNLSMNALCGNGAHYGVLDQTTESGMTPANVANVILNAVETHKTEVVPAAFTHKVAIILRAVFPSVFFWIMKKRARKQRQKEEKTL